MLAYHLQSSTSFIDDLQINLTRGKRNVTVPLQRVLPKEKEKLTFCVPPFYWYSNWPKIIFALEMWKAQGVDHIIVYHHSSTKNVYHVLTRYQAEGYITIVPWPSLPRSAFEDPNESVYRVAHSLANNDCLMRLSSEFGAVIDVDEIIVPRNGTLLSFIIESFAKTSAGALMFLHRALSFNPSYAERNFTYKELNFFGIWNANELECKGPPKVVFRTEDVESVYTHNINQFKRNSSVAKVRLEDAALLHHRYNVGIERVCKSLGNIDLLPTKSDFISLQNILNYRKRTIFPDMANFHFSTQVELATCLQQWRLTQHECITPISSCADVMLPLEEWQFTKLDEQFHTL
ncbi:unnamed protein product [Cylicocyclus nassatus]|uniref:Glycosyltransferase family 92 protein n=1 Tax=Cylicocyclus nassatus TaxID=53992 RepID=A0AA36GCE4_CYLNA|nr:unnamed protein product [Cylicocyclus nassatus]